MTDNNVPTLRLGVFRAILLIIIAALTLSGIQAGPATIEQDDILYGYGDGVPLYMNVIRPRFRPKTPMPAVVWIHGGGWHTGNRYSGQVECDYLAKRGFFTASIDYRPSQEAVWPAQLHDCKSAVRALRARAATWGIDANHIGVWGESAGGHLAALMGTTGGVASLEGDGGNGDRSSRVQAVCDWYGPTDLSRLDEMGSDLQASDPYSAPALLFGSGGFEHHRQAVQDANPCHWVTRDDAPFLIVHGTNDCVVPLGQSELLERALTRVGLPVQLVVLPNAGHCDPLFESTPVLALCARFFDRTLRPRIPRSKMRTASGEGISSHSREARNAPAGQVPRIAEPAR
ncbi:MAG: alpha/beta hydrolase [Capsulimonadaceae bacterium]|nr:alpha/beta hydrolase [Capsulimonadaceae bacterium]